MVSNPPWRTTVHPRVCGELDPAYGGPACVIGSSPRVRGTPGETANPWRSESVHPRVCGELNVARLDNVAYNGSSPRVRGTRASPATSSESSRFIPACAGNSCGVKRHLEVGAVHPRVCGELRAAAHDCGYCPGSSPRVRGTHVVQSDGGRVWRFIPACAGNSSPASQSACLHAVHPRVCGELSAVRVASRANSGSSPRVRGTPQERSKLHCCARFIPACAGNSCDPPSRRTAATVHPRVCGELVRQQQRPRAGRRFIPACAGNSSKQETSRCASTVHPRVCGELPGGAAYSPSTERFIPACAGNSTRSSAAARWRTVHPRVCGELATGCSLAVIDHGSSPRVRGTPAWADRISSRSRFIPACAGNSRKRLDVFDPTTGSSPRVRGTPRRRLSLLHRSRFIPACAGNSVNSASTPSTCPGASPRVRGTPCQPSHVKRDARFIPACAGNSVVADAERPDVHGSSPRVRGTPKRGGAGSRGGRFIPACAGNSPRGLPSSLQTAVHPRVCGELDMRRELHIADNGSSPRVRGTPAVQRNPQAVRRFIPACAGNSVVVEAKGRRRAVHPRVCGELPSRCCGQRGDHGSSPRVRGTLLPECTACVPTRFIPACAGNSVQQASKRLLLRVHPRVCGELRRIGGVNAPVRGSSPRVRGTPLSAAGLEVVLRFIPACAGNSSARLPRRSCHRVHPRVCGELANAPGGVCAVGRFIPACAGNSQARNR